MLLVFLILVPILRIFSVVEWLLFHCLCGEQNCLRRFRPQDSPRAAPTREQVINSEASKDHTKCGPPEDTVVVLMPDTSAMLGASSALFDLDAAAKDGQLGASSQLHGSSEVLQPREMARTPELERHRLPSSMTEEDDDRVPRTRLACIWQPRASLGSEGGLSLVLYPASRARHPR
jgi:hypothetical protein